jgi:uncharacterized integral membrane protein
MDDIRYIAVSSQQKRKYQSVIHGSIICTLLAMFIVHATMPVVTYSVHFLFLSVSWSMHWP